MKTLLVALPGNENFAAELAGKIDCRVASVEWHRFPDAEWKVRFIDDVRGCSVALVCSLDRADDKILPLIFAAATARDLRAARLGVVAPYLGYMRQDRRFHEGEAISARYFPRILSSWIDWLVTADPHLHRIHSLEEIYPIPSTVVHCSTRIGHWIGKEIADPLIVGPDAESNQWAEAIAGAAAAPYVVLAKNRRGDRNVHIDLPDFSHWQDRQPVLIDDIISTGQSMIEARRGLASAGFADPWCVAVHAVFAQDAFAALEAAGMAGIATCNTVAHSSNRIDVIDLFSEPVLRLMTANG